MFAKVACKHSVLDAATVKHTNCIEWPSRGTGNLVGRKVRLYSHYDGDLSVKIGGLTIDTMELVAGLFLCGFRSAWINAVWMLASH